MLGLTLGRASMLIRTVALALLSHLGPGCADTPGFSRRGADDATDAGGDVYLSSDVTDLTGEPEPCIRSVGPECKSLVLQVRQLDPFYQNPELARQMLRQEYPTLPQPLTTDPVLESVGGLSWQPTLDG